MDQIYLTVHFLDTSDREAIPGNQLTNGNLVNGNLVICFVSLLIPRFCSGGDI